MDSPLNNRHKSTHQQDHDALAPVRSDAERMSEIASQNGCSVQLKQKAAPIVSAGSSEKKGRISVLMSGGVDSSATALLLKQQGYEVLGLTGWLIKSGSRCCDTGMVDAARVCEQLEIPHHIVDLQELFRLQVIEQFHQAYARAQTPLPCSVCNTVIKWGALMKYGQKILDAPLVATGHYARILHTDSGPRLARARDPRKDQSYVLWGLTMEQLSSTLLPLGDYSKEEIRQIASDHGLTTAQRPDSQDLCFIPQGQTTQAYLSNFLDEAPGPIVHAVSGRVLGEHKGTHNFTIGQRRGLNVAAGEILYVSSIDPETRTVYAGPKEALLRRELFGSMANWLQRPIPAEPFEALCKIRYNSEAVAGTVFPLDAERVRVVFDEAQPAITPGQVLGIYDCSNTYLIGGAWID